jgi:hypothetical protein
MYINPHFKEMKDGRTEFLLSKPPTLDIVDKIDKSQQEACPFPLPRPREKASLFLISSGDRHLPQCLRGMRFLVRITQHFADDHAIFRLSQCLFRCLRIINQCTSASGRGADYWSHKITLHKYLSLFV